MNYSSYQLDIFNWVQAGKGNLIVQAVAGSGKSSTCLQAMNYMKGNVLSLAFNKKIAEHLKSKISPMALPNASAATFHSEGLKNLIKSKGRVTVNNSKVYYLTEQYCDTPELGSARPFIQKLVGFAKEYAFGVEGQRNIDDTSAWMEIIQTQDISLDADITLEAAIEISKMVLKDSNRDFRNIDFADMIYLPLIYNISCVKYDWLIVDEAQDTNVSRKLFLSKILSDNGRMLIVGDAQQSIYMFCGAENDSMTLLKDMFDCAELPLSICYRCGKVIITEAQKYQPHIEAFEENIEGAVSSMKYEDFLTQAATLNLTGEDLILCRNNAPNVSLAFALIRVGIGCRIEGRDIGQNLLTLCNKWKTNCLTTFTEKLIKYFDKEFEKASKVKMQLLEDKLEVMVILIERCQSLGKHDVSSLKALIESMFSDSDNVKGKDAHIVTLSSIHKAKGLEASRVFEIGHNQLIPSKYANTTAAKQQEENLLYISTTRAKHTLIKVTDIPLRNKQAPVEEN